MNDNWKQGNEPRREQKSRRKGTSRNSGWNNAGAKRKISPTHEARLRTDRILIVRNCRIYVDTSSLMNPSCRCGLRKLVRIMGDFGRWLYVPACVVSLLEHLGTAQKATAREAGLALRRLDKRLAEGNAEICTHESEGKHMDKTAIHIMTDLPDGEKALFITEDRALAATLNAMGKAPGERSYGRVAACRIDADGYLLPLSGMDSSCAEALGLTTHRSHSEANFCPHAYKPSEWDGQLD